MGVLAAALLGLVLISAYAGHGAGPAAERPTLGLLLAVASGTTYGGVAGWGFTASLTWTPRAQTSLDDALLQIDTDVILNNGAVGGAFAASGSRDMSTYKAATSRQIAELYTSRVDLSRAGPAGLSDLVRRAIDIQELDARLDIFTDGAVSAWIAEPQPASGSEQR